MPSQTEHRTPGQLIQELLETHGWTQRVLSIVLGCGEPIISKIIAGTQPIDAKMALALGDIFDVVPMRFLDLQKSFDLAQAKLITRDDPERTNRAHLFGKLPISEMNKRGWIDAPDIRDVPRVQAELSRFFRANSPDEIEVLPHVAKKTQVTGEVTPIQLAWLCRVREIAEEMLTARYSPSGVMAAVERLSTMRSSADAVRKVPRILQDAGIRYVIAEPLAGSGIDGVCFWIKDTIPVIGMSLRYDRIDNFWFVLRHELEHVIQKHGQSAMMFDAELEGEKAGEGLDIPEEERIANKAAAEFCVPQRSLQQFIDRKSPAFSDRDILGFARTLKVHPGLVAGQLRFKTKQYQRFSSHIVKIRSFFDTSPFIDGWGFVAPVGF